MALEEPEQQDDQDKHDKESNDAHDLRPPFLDLMAPRRAAHQKAAIAECPVPHFTCASFHYFRT